MPEEKKPEEKPGESQQKTLEEQIAELTADRDKWKNMSRQNEKRYEDVSAERDQLKQSQMSDSEKALEDARAEARKQALGEFGTELATAAMTAEAAKAGATLPDSKFLNLNQFLGEDGRPNAAAITAFVTSLPKANGQQQEPFPELQGAGHHQTKPGEVTSMDPKELADLIAGDSFI
ncbi:hypothetical protein [Streptomyces decoyicus]